MQQYKNVSFKALLVIIASFKATSEDQGPVLCSIELEDRRVVKARYGKKIGGPDIETSEVSAQEVEPWAKRLLNEEKEFFTSSCSGGKTLYLKWSIN